MTTHDATSTPADPSGLEGIRENLEAVGALLRETAARAAETEARAAENEARAAENEARAAENHKRAMREMAELRESRREAERLMKERQKKADRRQKEADRRQKEIDRQMKETDRQMKETDRRLKKAEDLFTTQWGRLMESLVRGDLVALLNERDIEVERTLQRVESRRGGRHFEVDLLAVNGREVVVVEVKTTLRSEGVTKFLSKLSEFLDWCAEYRGRRILGAVAYLDGAESVTKYAERSGLFVIRATGSSASLLNEPGFEPRVFS